MNKLSKKVFITGGHLTPAVAVIDEIIRRKLPWEIIFIGRMYAVEGSSEKAKEEEVITSKKIRFVPFTTGRLQRAFSLYTIVSLVKIPFGFVQALILCTREKPDIVVSFGGYIALPVVVASYISGIPVLTHEQTRVPGLSNRIIARFARKICISFPDIRHTFPRERTVYTGLPIRKEIFETPLKPAFSLPVKKYPLIYITGGTTG
jgi:UDP-N-acetylglucosamine--N-acetylmuramyl-(pentapeptide) pyrophosphoryl-undecaprenol N-acetylglucosamine transferase